MHMYWSYIRSDTRSAICMQNTYWLYPEIASESFLSKENGTDVNGLEQYSENIKATMLTTMLSFVSSVAVTSMKIFLVFSVIFECCELMIGGSERTRSCLS